MVVTLLVANYTTRRILSDSGSSANILFWDVFIEMGFFPNKLQPSPTPLKGFFKDAIQPLGAITLLIMARKRLQTATYMTDLIVVKALSSYNSILGHPFLNNVRVVSSTYHLKMKFLMKEGVGEV